LELSKTVGVEKLNEDDDQAKHRLKVVQTYADGGPQSRFSGCSENRVVVESPYKGRCDCESMKVEFIHQRKGDQT
jgi:hypothetical protein